jgi:exodeoxyribonuclease-3
VVEQKLESSEAISETPSKKRSRTKQKSTESTTVEENSVTNVKINKTSIKKETLVGMLSFYLSLLGTSFLFGKLLSS